MRTYFITHTSEQKHKKDWLSLNFPNMDDWNAIFNQTFYVQYLRFADFTLHCNVRRLPSADASDRVRVPRQEPREGRGRYGRMLFQWPA